MVKNLELCICNGFGAHDASELNKNWVQKSIETYFWNFHKFMKIFDFQN